MRLKLPIQGALCFLGLTAVLGLQTSQSLALPLSPGDRIKISIPEGDLFNGTYEVNLDGTLNLPYLQSLSIAGLEPTEVEKNVTSALVKNKLFNPRFARTTVQVVEWAPIQVNVAGAAFQPGRVLINERAAEVRAQKNQASGDYPPDRFLSAAIRSAGGVLPNADIQSVKLIRNGREQTYDLTSIFKGDSFDDVPLMAGDRIVIPNLAKVNNELVRPSQITLQNVKVFLSNLAQANNSAPTSKDPTAFVYGSRFTQAVIAAGCAGGNITSSKRRAVLVRTDRMTGQTQVVDRPVEELLRKPNDDTVNPYLMPDDGIACYDSRTTNIRGVAETLSTIFSPFSLLFNLFR
jgi:polysaccharide biosynthesis/export protein